MEIQLILLVLSQSLGFNKMYIRFPIVPFLAKKWLIYVPSNALQCKSKKKKVKIIIDYFLNVCLSF